MLSKKYVPILTIWTPTPAVKRLNKKKGLIVMASLTYQIASHVKDMDKAKQFKRPQKDKNGNPLDTSDISTASLKQYKHHAIKFGEWCKVKYHCRKFEDCATHLQDYATALKEKGKSASTIHTYLAAVCRVWGVDLAEIKKPRRVVSENTRSRGVKAVDKRSDAKPDASPRLYEFAKRVGLRRREYQRLCGDSLALDESGNLCIRVRGKGGKLQYQRLLPEDEAFVRAYFDDKDADECIFLREELDNKIDLHHLRALQAQRAYAYYLEHIEEADFREKLIAELQARWEAANNKKAWNPQLVEGGYYLRGKNREFAQAHGLPVSYDRLALKAVSVFHLSHWRDDVTVQNYLLAQ
jgi:hypothetical protein